MKQHPSTWSLALATLAAPVAWGTTYVTVTELLPPDRPLFVALMRVAPAGVLLVAVGVARSRRWMSAAEWARTLLLAVLNFGLFFPLLVVAVYRLPGGIAAAVGGMQPLLVGAGGWLVLRQRPGRLDVAVGIAAALGVAMVVVRPGAGIDPIGVLAALGANCSFAAGVVATKALPAPADRVTATGWQLVVATLLIAPVALLVEGAPPPLSATHVAGFAYLSVVATAGAFLLWFNGVRGLPVAAPPLLGLAAPVTGAALGWLLLGESMSATQLVGFGVTIGAIGYAATAASARSTSPEPRPRPRLAAAQGCA